MRFCGFFFASFFTTFFYFCCFLCEHFICSLPLTLRSFTFLFFTFLFKTRIDSNETKYLVFNISLRFFEIFLFDFHVLRSFVVVVLISIFSFFGRLPLLVRCKNRLSWYFVLCKTINTYKNISVQTKKNERRMPATCRHIHIVKGRI